MSGVLWKGLVTACTLLAGGLAQRALSSGWKAATGHTPPTKPESPDVGVAEAVAFAAIAGALLNVARVVAIRQAARYWTTRRGSLPKALQDAF